MTSERARRSSSVPRQRSGKFTRSPDTTNRTPRNFESIGPPVRKTVHNSTLARTNYPHNQRAFSLDRKKEPREIVEIEMDPMLLANTPILCNKYVVGKNEGFARTIPGKGNGTPVFFL